MDYGPFGQELFGGTGMPDRRYAGLVRDGEAGLDSAGARSYQPRTGRFSTVDPIYAGVFDPQRWNRYSYALNSPASFADSTGMLAAGPLPGCNAEFSFLDCGGSAAFWAPSEGGRGIEFGNGLAQAKRDGYVVGMPSDMWTSLQDFNNRVNDGFDANAANAAIAQGDIGRADSIVQGNPNLVTLGLPDLRSASHGSYQQAVDAYLYGFGLWGLIEPGSLSWKGHGYTFAFNNQDAALSILQGPAFASGFLGALHANDVGFPNQDYRSWTSPVTPFSLQVTWGSKAVWADIDRFNPYDVAGWISHAILEVAPVWKKPWPW